MGKKLAEEAIEVVIDAMHGDSEAVKRESADLLYNLIVLWVASGVHPKDVWMEMERRERLLGIAEKIPKRGADVATRDRLNISRSARPRERGTHVACAVLASGFPACTGMSGLRKASARQRKTVLRLSSSVLGSMDKRAARR